MKRKISKRLIHFLIILAALFTAAFICGRGQQITPQSPAEPVEATQEVEISQETPEGEIAPQEPVEVQPEPPEAEQPPEQEVPPDAGQADLIIQNASVTARQNPGEVDVSVVAEKQGNAQVTSSFTIIWKPHAQSNEIGCSWDVNANKINQGPVGKSCQYTYPSFGEMHWSAIVDSNNDVVDENNTNNTYTGVVLIQKVQVAPNVAPPFNCSWRVASVPRIIELTWQYNMPADIDGFRIYMAGTSLELTVGKNANQASIQNLELSTQYHFDVRAFKGNVESAVDMCSVDATTGQ
jgi:hypothetical protein